LTVIESGVDISRTIEDAAARSKEEAIDTEYRHGDHRRLIDSWVLTLASSPESLTGARG
jgi:hypothetical protein